MRIMNLWPEWPWSARRKAATNGGIAASLREGQGMGVWQDIMGKWQPRSRNPYLLEALREAIPILDGGISRLTTMDGIITVEGANDKLVQEIEQWMNNVPVNDLETGYQAFYRSQGDEHYEQGVGIGEFIYDGRGREVVGLRVADSKGVCFVRHEGALRTFYRAPEPDSDRRADGLGQVEQILRGSVRHDVLSGLRTLGFVELDARQLVFALNKPEADNPYGTSILRSIPFVAQILLKMQNATGRAWERFGDPSYHVHYGTKNAKVDATEAQKRANTIADNLGKAMLAKKRGNSMDLATAAARDDEIKVEVIGGAGEVLEIEAPARSMLEQIVAGFGLPAWMLGVQWGQAAGIGEQQSVVVLQESETRFAVRKPQLRRPIEAMLRARGRTWKPGDWDLVQRLPNLMDEQKRAQAGFLRAQTALMLGESGQVDPAELRRGIDNNLRTPRTPRSGKARGKADDTTEGEPWARNDPALPALEATASSALKRQWHALAADALRTLGLDTPDGEAFEMAPGTEAMLLAQGNARVPAMAKALLDAQLGAWDRGVRNGADDLDSGKGAKGLMDDPVVQAAIARLRDRVRDSLTQTGLQLVRDGFARQYQSRIVAALASGEFDGQNPVNVARELQRRFDGGDYNWERLARSEIAMAQSDGSLALYEQQGITLVDYSTAEDEFVSTICRELAAAGPYPIDKCPVPVRDSHPACRCTCIAHS
ncbi:minor capsid protein [Pseudoxanthomonas mexicana]